MMIWLRVRDVHAEHERLARHGAAQATAMMNGQQAWIETSAVGQAQRSVQETWTTVAGWRAVVIY